ncbi:hybrid sensor histidine kinase/response regulator [Actibacterium lipolyticum]|uniref:histidine kinase n=1 Tax=Actibacterium lipolyticum TaxID=1524263 RepID=A0A238JTZ0_9RHOB|nr:ATP-binding protein [Actibacterium lipolyticum]SMX33226.1 Sensory/regulatory protein RpfC [Actibacterium lipolyticum]
MSVPYSATSERRHYNRWVANETKEDFALRFTARRARRWGYGQVANTALGSISFLALEAIGGAITLSYGFDTAIIAIMLVGLLLFLTGLPISYYAARYGVDIDLLTRGAGFGYLGSTITSLIYASFTFIFFALEAAILAFAIQFCFGIPLSIGYLISALVVIPLVINGFSKISVFQAWSQPFWVILHILPFALMGFAGMDTELWTSFDGIDERGKDGATLLMIGAASGVVFSLIAQIGEQVDFLRFLPEPKTRGEKRKWLAALVMAGPGWSILGVLKMIAGSFLVTLALNDAVPAREAADPTQMYFTAFDQVLTSPALVLFLTGAFVILSQLKINVTNAYAGSIAWSNFFSRLTHSHPGRVVWLVFNVAIALMLMELGVFHSIEAILALYSHVALAWIGALTADLVINKPLGFSPPGIEFRRAHLYDINPVGIGAMCSAVLISLLAYAGVMGDVAHALSSFIALLTAFCISPVIAWRTGGKYYIARPATTPPQATQECCVCEYRFDAEDMTDCPFYSGPICSLCCTLDSSCRDSCKPHARLDSMVTRLIRNQLPSTVADALMSRLSIFAIATIIPAGFFGIMLIVIRSYAAAPELDAVLAAIFASGLVVIGVAVWAFILAAESQHKARDEASTQTQRLLREVRAHKRTDLALQEAKEKAEAANLAKTRYMAGISHELRTPLNAIYGFAQILETDPRIPSHRKDAVSTIRRSSEHLAGLIEGLLDISKIEAGRMELFRDRINLPAFLRQVASIFAAAAEEKNLSFKITTSGNLPDWVSFDEKRLRQIIINLLSNAINYTEQGAISLSVTYRNEVAVIEVSDTGRGIDPEKIDRIWKPFERLTNSGTQGSGLGLTITKLLVEVLGGEITVKSTPGKGSTFRVRLMLPSIMDGERPARNREPTLNIVGVTGYTGSRKTVLVVDDDRNHLTLTEHFLEPLGFLVLVANSADAALDMLSDITPDIFILDIDMPGRDGWELAECLREQGHRATPIIMISGHALEARKPDARGGLFDAFIVKPYNLEDLVFRIGELLRLELNREPSPPRATQRPIAAKDITALLEDARIGHATGVRRKLDELRESTGVPEPTLSKLLSRLDDFDMPGITRLLEELYKDAA